MAKSLGVCECATKGCTESAEIREMRGKERGAAGRLYLYCPSCGVVRSTGATLQNYIIQHGEFSGELPFCQDATPKDQEPIQAKPEKQSKSDIWEGW